MTRAGLAGSAILALCAAPAIAADLPVKARPMVPVMTVYNWSGCYIGGNVGGKWARTSGEVDNGAATGPAGTTPASIFPLVGTTSGTVIGGGQVGCNWQAQGSNWVFGVEGDADAQRWSASRTALGAPLPFNFVPGDTFDIRSNWQASLRGRIGYAWDRSMIYGTGGVGFTNVRVGSTWVPAFIGTIPVPGLAVTDSKTLFGPTAGLGVEYAFTNNWSFGVEGRYTWYGTQSFNAGAIASAAIGPAAAPTLTLAPNTQSIRVETFEVTARLNYKFDWGSPVVARY